MPLNIPGLKHHFYTMKSQLDQLELHYRLLTPENPIKSIIVIHHGFGDHSGRYENLIASLHDQSTAFYALDARGHGRSQGKRGHVDEFSDFQKDLDQLINVVHKQHPNIPVILAGHSMGGLVALDYCRTKTHQKKLSALITSSPALKVELNFLGKIKKFIGFSLSRVTPGLVMNAGLNIDNISSCKEAQKAYTDDDYVHGLISVSLGLSLLDIGEKLIQQSKQIHLPVFITHGTEDKIASPSGSEELYEHIGSPDKTLKIYDNRRHELFNETKELREQPLTEMMQWYQNIKSKLIS